MAREQYRPRRKSGVGQRIGPALRALRHREGLTLEELAEQCDLSRTFISRVEQGKSDVTLPTLMSLSTALGVDITYFASYQDASSQTENELRAMLSQIEIAPDAIPELLTLSFEAQGALLDSLRWLTLAHHTRPLRARELVDQLLAHGIEASIAYILSGIAEFGLDVDGFCRVITQMEELSGDRLVMSDRLLSVTAPMGARIDPINIFRSIFQREPEDPRLVRLWAQSLQSAVRQNVEQFETRTIYPLSSIRSYIDSGHWGVGVDVDPDLVQKHVFDLIETLRTKPNVHVGLLDDDLPFNLLVKGERQAMAYVRLGTDIFPGQSSGVAYRTTRPDVVRKFREYFDQMWERIPAEHKESNAVTSWLEQRIAARTE